MIRRVALLVSVVVALVMSSPRSALAGEAQAPSDERVILHTVAGDLVLTLYPSVAPRTVEHFLKLVRAGIYDTTAFVRVEPGFVVQLSAANDRSKPLNEYQKELIRKLPGEFSSVPHVRGILSMAREDGDPDSGETSFSILLGPAPHLDKKYTVFGRLEGGDAVLEEILRVPRGAMMRPVVRIEVTRAEVVSSSALGTMAIAPAQAVPLPADLAASASGAAGVAPALSPSVTTGPDVASAVAGGLALIGFVALVSFLLQGRVPSSVHGALSLVVVLVAAFMLLVVLMPQGQRHPWLAAPLFFGLVGLFKLLGRFERPA